jgi:sigma-E factor negative regulatory protein RseA
MSTEQQRQRISSLVDGEAGRFEAAAAINDLVRSPELAACWERWHLIGRALRGEPNDEVARTIAARVRTTIATDRAGRRTDGRRRQGARLWQPLGGAIAAGLLVLGLAATLSRSPQPSAAPDFARNPTRPAAQLVSERWQQSDPVVRGRLDRLLVNHQEQAAGLGGPGMAAYAAVIGYERLP